MFQVAGTIGKANAAGSVARFDPNWQYRKCFNISDDYFEPVPIEAVRVDSGADYLQRLELFQACESLVRDAFRPSPVYAELVENRCRDLGIGAGDVVVGMHVRRGDFEYVQHLFKRLPAAYYANALGALRDRGVCWSKALLFTDAPDSVRKEFRGLTQIEVVEPDVEDVIDMFCLSSCDYHVIANSTYSWWSAYLAQRPHVIYPDTWAVGDYEYKDRVHQIIPDSSAWMQIPVVF